MNWWQRLTPWNEDIGQTFPDWLRQSLVKRLTTIPKPSVQNLMGLTPLGGAYTAMATPQGQKVTEYASLPITWSGMGLIDIAKLMGGKPITEFAPSEEGFAKSMLPGGELYKKYKQSPWWQQMLAESPAWFALPSGVGGKVPEIAKGAKELAFGEAGAVGKFKPITETLWESMGVPERVKLAQNVGLEGKIGSKPWLNLTQIEKDTLLKIPKTEIPRIKPPTTIEIRNWRDMGLTPKDIAELKTMSPELRELTTHQARLTGFRNVSNEAVDDYLQKALILAKKRGDTKAIESLGTAIEYNNAGQLQPAILESEKGLGYLHQDELAEFREIQRVTEEALRIPKTEIPTIAKESYQVTFPLGKKVTFFKAMDVAPETSAIEAFGKGTYVAPTVEGAKMWGQNISQVEATLNKVLVVPQDSDLVRAAINVGYEGKEPNTARIIEWAQKNGYDAIVGKSSYVGADHINIINPKVITKISGVVPETGGIKPPVKPPIPELAPEVEETGKFPALNRIIIQSQEVVRQDRPGIITRITERVPVLKQLIQFERPGLKMVGENEKLLVANVAQEASHSEVSTKLLGGRLPLFTEIEKIFGKGTLRGSKVDIPFIGTKSQANNKYLTNTLLDIANNPELYVLNDAQKTLLARIQTHTDAGLKYVTEGYGAEIGRFPPKPGGAHLPNVDISEDALTAIGGEQRAVISGRGRTRIWQTARDRMTSDPSFKPELDVQRLIEGSDNFKAGMAGNETFKAAVGGKTRLEVMAETHPALSKKMEALRKRLGNLRSMSRDIDKQTLDAISSFLESPTEGDDLAQLREALDITVQPGRYVSKTSPYLGLGGKELQQEINQIRVQIKALKPAWESANLHPYQFVQEGIYRYFPADQAKLLRELKRTTNNSLLNFIEKWRGQAFSGDVSPFAIQDALGVLADPWGSLKATKGALGKFVETGDWLRTVKLSALADDIARDPEGWAQFASLMGRDLSGTPREFSAGFLSKIPGFDKFTEGTYITVTRGAKDLYDRSWRMMVKRGVPELQAKVSSAATAREIFPLISPARLGQSQARAALLRAMPTSYSFIRQPATMLWDATKGFIKLGLKQTLTPREKLSMQLMTTMAASTLTVSATSAAISAQVRGRDVKQAILDAINPDPRNGKFASIIVGDTRIPLAGPYRSLFRAMYPQEVSGIPFPVPFGGLPNYVKNRVTPAIRAQVDLIRNKDYYSEKILKGNFPEQLLRGLAYEVESALPLTAGAIAEGIRRGQTLQEIQQQMVGQFAGVNPIPPSPYQRLGLLRDELTQKTFGMSWVELGRTQGELAQVQLTKSSPELQKAEQVAEEALSKREDEVNKTWTNWRKEGEVIEQTYQKDITLAVQEFEQTGGGTTFRNKVDDAALVRRKMYAARQINPQYTDIQKSFAQPLTAEQTARINPADLARREYYNIMYSPDMYDQYGNYNFDEAEKREQYFIQKYGQGYLDYINEYAGIKWEEPTALKELRRARETLKPYWDIEDRVWAQYPPQVRQAADQIQTMSQGDARAEKLLLFQTGYGPQILYARRLIALLRKRMRLEFPQVDLALNTFYGY